MRNILFIISVIPPPVGVIVVIVRVLPCPGVVVHALQQSHPQHLVEGPGVRAVGPVALVRHLEAVGLLSIHVAAVGRTSLAVDAQVTAVRSILPKKWRECVRSWPQYCSNTSGSCRHLVLQHISPPPAGVTDILADSAPLLPALHAGGVLLPPP